MIRVLLAKPGLDGHDRGVKVVGMALRDAGAEVVYLGLQQTAEAIVAAAVAEDADVIGLSVLSGVHLRLTEELIDARQRAGATEIAVVVGGTIPPRDRDRLREIGASGVFAVGTPIQDVVAGVFRIAGQARS
jgi:methylmalonyl-CoA mutase C-terminal domain/subunit